MKNAWKIWTVCCSRLLYLLSVHYSSPFLVHINAIIVTSICRKQVAAHKDKTVVCRVLYFSSQSFSFPCSLTWQQCHHFLASIKNSWSDAVIHKKPLLNRTLSLYLPGVLIPALVLTDTDTHSFRCQFLIEKRRKTRKKLFAWFLSLLPVVLVSYCLSKYATIAADPIAGCYEG